ncbi:MAG: hypothetical protein HYZ18_05575 [Pseudogulbenkiania sp.]|nr:hypothetical protein [Pseudogulbenkiania sp.]
MSTFEQCRDEIVALINTAIGVSYPTLKVFYENTLSVDLDTVGDRFVRIELEFDDAAQLTINNTPADRTYGTVYFTIFLKEGLGTRPYLELVQFFKDLVAFKTATHYRFEVVRPGKRGAPDGWRSYEVTAPFWFDAGI